MKSKYIPVSALVLLPFAAFAASSLDEVGPPFPQRSAIRETQKEPPVETSPAEVENRLTKNWGGARKTLSDQGVDLAVIFKEEFNKTLSGGLSHQPVYLNNLDVRLSIDADKLFGAKGLSFFVYGLGDSGGKPSKNVGDVQMTSNIETSVSAFKLYELWGQYLMAQEKVSLLAGFHDLNSEFYSTESSGLFFNSSFGVGKDLSQTGVNGPSIFPTTSAALRLRVEPTPGFVLQWAAFDAQAGNPKDLNGTHLRLNLGDGLLLITEADFIRGKADSDKGSLPGKYGFGVWTYTRTFDSFDTGNGASQGNSSGAYFLADQALIDWISVFARYGVASTSVNRFGSCLGLGTVFTGLIPGRSNDRFGIALAEVFNGDNYIISQNNLGTSVSRAERSYEFNYRIEVTPGIAVQPDFQIVVHPNTDPSIGTAKVMAVRGEISL